MAAHTKHQVFEKFTEKLSFIKPGNSERASQREAQALITSYASWGFVTPSTSAAQSVASSVDGADSKRQASFTEAGLSYVKQGFSAVRDRAEAAATRVQDNIEETQSSFQRYVYCFLALGVGVFFIFSSFLFLPLLVLAPQKFALLFTIGSLFVINGLGLLRGYTALFRHLTRRSRVAFSVMYFVSLCGTLYVTLALRRYFATICFASIQLVSLITLLFSYVTGGDRIISFFRNCSVGVAMKMFNANESILPL